MHCSIWKYSDGFYYKEALKQGNNYLRKMDLIKNQNNKRKKSKICVPLIV